MKNFHKNLHGPILFFGLDPDVYDGVPEIRRFGFWNPLSERGNTEFYGAQVSFDLRNIGY